MIKFITKFLLFLIIILILVLSFSAFYSQQLVKYCDTYFKQFNHYVSFINSILFQQWLTGITFGTLVLVFILMLYPLFTKKIDTKSYFKNVFQGIIASFIFFLSQAIYSYVEKINKLYLIITIFGSIIISFLLIQFVSGMYKKETAGVEFRTANVASITAGLIFGILLQFITIGMELLKIKISSFHF